MFRPRRAGDIAAQAFERLAVLAPANTNGTHSSETCLLLEELRRLAQQRLVAMYEGGGLLTREASFLTAPVHQG